MEKYNFSVPRPTVFFDTLDYCQMKSVFLRLGLHAYFVYLCLLQDLCSLKDTWLYIYTIIQVTVAGLSARKSIHVVLIYIRH